MGKPPKIDRKTLKQPDEFVTSGRSFLDVLVERRNLVAALVGVGCLVAAGYYGYAWWAQKRLNEGWMQYLEASKVEKAEDKMVALKSFVEGTGNIRPRFQAAVDLGDYHFAELKKTAVDPAAKKPADAENLAVKWYGDALSYGGLLPMERQLLLINLGQAYELGGDVAQAQSQYQSASDIQGEARGLALLNLGRSFEALGEPAKAKESYEKVVQDFSGTEYARMARNYQRAIDSPLVKEISGE